MPTHSKLPLADRLWRRVYKTKRCWIWLGGTQKGYGAIQGKGRVERAHRVAWTLTKGPIPKGKWVLHRCDTPACVRPSHLFLGTRRDNMADCKKKGRTARGSGHGRAKVTEADVLVIRRRCAAGELQRVVGADFGLTQPAVSEIVSGVKWSHLLTPGRRPR